MAHILHGGEPPGDAEGQNTLLHVLPNRGGNNSGFVSASGPDFATGLTLQCESASDATAASSIIKPQFEPIFIIPGAAKRHERLCTHPVTSSPLLPPAPRPSPLAQVESTRLEPLGCNDGQSNLQGGGR